MQCLHILTLYIAPLLHYQECGRRRKERPPRITDCVERLESQDQVDLEDEMKEILAESEDSLDLVDVNDKWRTMSIIILLLTLYNDVYYFLSQVLCLSHHMLRYPASRTAFSIWPQQILRRVLSHMTDTRLCPTATPLNIGPTFHDVSSYS